MVVIPGWRFAQYLAVACGLIRRYGAREPTVAQALLRMLSACAVAIPDDPRRRRAIEEQAGMIVAEAERLTDRREDLAVVFAEAESIRRALDAGRLGPDGLGGQLADTPATPPPS